MDKSDHPVCLGVRACVRAWGQPGRRELQCVGQAHVGLRGWDAPLDLVTPSREAWRTGVSWLHAVFIKRSVLGLGTLGGACARGCRPVRDTCRLHRQPEGGRGPGTRSGPAPSLSSLHNRFLCSPPPPPAPPGLSVHRRPRRPASPPWENQPPVLLVFHVESSVLPKQKLSSILPSCPPITRPPWRGSLPW